MLDGFKAPIDSIQVRAPKLTPLRVESPEVYMGVNLCKIKSTFCKDFPLAVLCGPKSVVFSQVHTVVSYGIPK